jgi:hypothetical protein
MKKVMVARGQMLLFILLALCAILLISSIIIGNIKGANETHKILSVSFQLIALALLVAVIHITGKRPLSYELFLAAKAEAERESLQEKVLSKLIIKKISINEMGMAGKLFYFLLLASAWFIIGLGAADFIDLIPGNVKLPSGDGNLLALPHWVSGIGEILAALIILGTLPLLKIKIVERQARILRLVPKK